GRRGILEDDLDSTRQDQPPASANAKYVVPLEQHLTPVGGKQPAQDPCDGGCSGSGFPNHTQSSPARDRKRDIVQRLGVGTLPEQVSTRTEALAKITDLKQRCHTGKPLPPGCRWSDWCQ